MRCWDSSGGLVGCFFLFSFSSSFLLFNKHNTTTEHRSEHIMDIIIQICMYYLCTHTNYTKGIQTVTQTHGHTDKQSDKHIVDSHTQTNICLTDCMPHV